MSASPLQAPDQGNASSAAQRQRAYRQRHRRATIESIGNESAASRVTLLASLRAALATLDNPRRSASHPGSRNTAQRALREIVTRYAITLHEER